MKLPTRKFKLGEYVWATVGGLVHYARVFGHEDGRRLRKSPYHGWIYYVTLTGADDQKPRCARSIVQEDQLRKIDEGSE